MSHHAHLPPEIDEAIRSFIRRNRRGLRWGCVLTALISLVLAGVAVWGLSRGAVHLKNWAAGKTTGLRLPLEWEKPLGDAALGQLRGQYRFVTDPRVIDPLERLASPLFPGETNSPGRFALFVTESKEVNALALPGGYVVFHRGLLERANSAEEIQGVLAHEMAHVQLRHGVLQLAQNIGLDFAFQQLQSGESRLLDALIRDSGQLLSLKFSRDHERAADDRGWETLLKAQIDPRGMVDFFSRLSAAAGAGTGSPSPLLSTHPAPWERLDRLRQKAAAIPSGGFRSSVEDFEALRNALGAARNPW